MWGPQVRRECAGSCKKSNDGAGVKEGFSGSFGVLGEREAPGGGRSEGKPWLASGLEAGCGEETSAVPHGKGARGCRQDGPQTRSWPGSQHPEGQTPDTRRRGVGAHSMLTE